MKDAIEKQQSNDGRQDYKYLKADIEKRSNGRFTVIPKDNWGVGENGQAKPFAKAMFGNGENKTEVELIHGDYPHSRNDNTTYARTESGAVYDFDGHRLAFKIEIEEYNYLKSSGLSGDEIRKGCSVKVFVNGIQILDDFARGYERGYKIAERYIESLELFWGWFPFDVESVIGKVVTYENQPCKIERVTVSQGCLILSTLDGKPFKPFASSEDDDEPETAIKVKINSPNIWWYPKINTN